jgi:endonuclease/exonuclease/phosphatase (EEP) superfamily protein YafD
MRAGNAFRRLVGWLPLLYAAPLLIYLAARPWIAVDGPAFVPERAWLRFYELVSLLNEFTPFLFVPVPVWLATWLLVRALYGELFLPRPSDLVAAPVHAADAQVTVRIMTHNLRASTGAATGLLETIQAAAPDMLVVQELSPQMARSLDEALSAEYPHRRLRPASGGPGTGIWSRFPLLSEEVLDRSLRGDYWQHAVLEVHGQPLHVVNLHLSAPKIRWRVDVDGPLPIQVGQVTRARSSEVAGLAPRLRDLASGPAPLVVAGDLNLTDQTPEYRQLIGAGLVDAHRSAGWGFGHTFPSEQRVRVLGRRISVPVPLIRIDYVLHSPHLVTRRVQVLPAGGSDHHPVVADLQLQ